tara:strand:+ start:673 stop:1089 length:417 start_codon:yes stop_codon:yes gene_type:complete
MKYSKLVKKIKSINSSKFFAGLALIMLNIGSKYISLGLTKNQEGYLKHGLARQMLIFSIAWVGSKDLVISIILTAAFTVLAGYLFNENSNFCLLPNRWKHLYDSLDMNNDGIISDHELEEAINTLNKIKEKKIGKYYY